MQDMTKELEKRELHLKSILKAIFNYLGRKPKFTADDIRGALKDFPGDCNNVLDLFRPLAGKDGSFLSDIHKKAFRERIRDWYNKGNLNLTPIKIDSTALNPQIISHNKYSFQEQLPQKVKTYLTEKELVEQQAAAQRKGSIKFLGEISPIKWDDEKPNQNTKIKICDAKITLRNKNNENLKKDLAEIERQSIKSLYVAAMKGQIEEVRKLIKDGTPLNCQIQLNDYWVRPLTGAALCTDPETRKKIIELLIKNGANPDYATDGFKGEYANDILSIININKNNFEASNPFDKSAVKLVVKALKEKNGLQMQVETPPSSSSFDKTDQDAKRYKNEDTIRFFSSNKVSDDQLVAEINQLIDEIFPKVNNKNIYFNKCYKNELQLAKASGSLLLLQKELLELQTNKENQNKEVQSNIPPSLSTGIEG